MNYDRICQEDGFFIFGAGLLGRHICDNLLDAGLQVYGFLDNGSFVTPSYRGVEILPFQQMQDLTPTQKNAIVIVSLIDPFDHEKIKDSLLTKGFSRIICKREILRNEKTYQVNALYDKIITFRGNFQANMIVGDTFELWDTNSANQLGDQALICRQDGFVTAYIPIELLYAVGKPVVMQTQVTALFECFQGQNTTGVDLFWEYVCETQAGLPKNNMEQERTRIIGGRLRVYQNMVQALSLDTDFFRRHPVTVTKDGNVFTIADGMHRTLFLYIHGLRFIPCMMPETQYDSWLSAASITDTAAKDATVPVLHPYYYLNHSSYENTHETRTDVIIRFLADKNTDGLTAFDFGGNEGWIARNLCRSGLKTACLVHEEERDIVISINRLEQTEITLCQTPPPTRFDIVTNIRLKRAQSTFPVRLKQCVSLARHYVFAEINSLSDVENLGMPYQVLRRSYVFETSQLSSYLVVIKTYAG